jgi:hypothetical protein
MELPKLLCPVAELPGGIFQHGRAARRGENDMEKQVDTLDWTSSSSPCGRKARGKLLSSNLIPTLLQGACENEVENIV